MGAAERHAASSPAVESSNSLELEDEDEEEDEEEEEEEEVVMLEDGESLGMHNGDCPNTKKGTGLPPKRLRREQDGEEVEEVGTAAIFVRTASFNSEMQLAVSRDSLLQQVSAGNPLVCSYLAATSALFQRLFFPMLGIPTDALENHLLGGFSVVLFLLFLIACWKIVCFSPVSVSCVHISALSSFPICIGMVKGVCW